MNTNSSYFVFHGQGWFLTLGHRLCRLCVAIVAPVPKVGQECVQWSMPVRSAHKNRENTHQPKIAACISFPIIYLRNKAKSRIVCKPQLKAASILPRSPRLPACQGDSIKRSTHIEAAYIHSRTVMIAMNSGVDVTVLSPAALISAITTMRPSKLGTIEKATNGNSGSHMAAC